MSRGQRAESVVVLRPRLQIIVIFAGLFFITLIVRLFQLQVLEGEHFARRAEDNFVDTIDVEAPRGRIFDAKGRPLATNTAAYTLYVTARPRVVVTEEDEDGERVEVVRRVPINDEQIQELAELIETTDDADRANLVRQITELRDDEKNGRYAAAVRRNLTWDENAKIETREELRSWVEIRESARRQYPEKELTAFVTGYMREIDPERLAESATGEYRPGDRVGKTGIERHWENYLRGRLGSHSRVVNNVGREVANPPANAVAALPPDVDPIPGQDIHLSLDVDLQRVAYEALADRNRRGEHEEVHAAGGVVAMEVKTGRILAMASVPAINPNLWERPISQAQYQAWLESPFKPFVDKTVQENYFPGSTYKVVSALSMLEDPSYDPDALVECGRFVEYGGRKFHDTHACGPTDLESAIVQSCNVYFYRLAMEQDLTLAKMEATARRLGLGERTGLGLNGEARGVVPTEASESRQGRFQRGVRLNSAIGQGNVKTTVLQVAVLYATIANGGWVMTPSLVDRIVTADGKVVLENSAQPRNPEPVIAPWDRERIHRGLVGVVNDEHGTAYSERLPTVLVAGKTGTAQVGREAVDPDAEEIEGWDTTQDHAWFAAYAPAEEPEIVVVALVAHGGTGADAAAPIVMRVIDHYLGDRGVGNKPRPRPVGVPPSLPGEEARRRADAEGKP